MKRLLFVFFLALLTSCYGRLKDSSEQKSLNSIFSLSQGKPSLVVFSAIWCKPCRAEIEDLNKLADKYGNRIQIRSYVVEGEKRGSVPTDEEIKNSFLSISGEAPRYLVKPDGSWVYFDKLTWPQGRQLPSMVFFNGDGTLALTVQRSLDFESELIPVVERLIQNSPLPPTEEKPPILDIVKLNISEFIERPGNELTEALSQNLQKAWSKGRTVYGFPASKMPFLSGVIEFYVNNNVDIPVQMDWESDSESGFCSLSVKVNPDGSFLSSSGVCN